jgi:hypothetical protein
LLQLEHCPGGARAIPGDLEGKLEGLAIHSAEPPSPEMDDVHAGKASLLPLVLQKANDFGRDAKFVHNPMICA